MNRSHVRPRLSEHGVIRRSTPQVISLLSVESTGTHFTAEVLKRLTGRKIEWLHCRPEGLQVENIGGLLQHVYPKGWSNHLDATLELMLRADHVVIPMRNPIRALISNHDRGHGALSFLDHVRSFGRVSKWKERENVHFFQVDVPREEREAETEKLAGFLGVPLRCVPWERRNQTPKAEHSVLREWLERGEWERLDRALDGAIRRLGGLGGFFEGFGYEIPRLGRVEA